MDTRNCCKGMCCEAFSLGQLSPADVRARVLTREGFADDEFIADMLVPLGYFNRNPLHVVGNQDYAVQEMSTQSFMGAWFYTCRHYDKATRSCTVYEQRPQMCRKFPNDGQCQFNGCEFAVPRKMRGSYRYPGLHIAESAHLSHADIELLAQALDCPEDPIYQAGKRILKEVTVDDPT